LTYRYLALSVDGVQMNPATLTALRILAGYSQAELARRSGVSQGHISELERGDKKASPKTVKKLAEGLNVPMAALFGPAAGEVAS
jgi:transcriptional regulator with XRE-family HTH domain